jgi:hypothetical protein
VSLCVFAPPGKDEGHSVIEWVTYHKHTSFDNICVYNTAHGTDEMLIRLQELGLVCDFENNVPEGKTATALSLAAEN